jgi:hypothetical protein
MRGSYISLPNKIMAPYYFLSFLPTGTTSNIDALALRFEPPFSERKHCFSNKVLIKIEAYKAK